MRVLVIGSGGREHALAWKLAQSPSVSEVFCTPGNGGTAQVAENIVPENSLVGSLADLAEQYRIDLTVVGPETTLESGVVDEFQRRGLAIYGPTQAAARLETSKVFAKEFMRKYQIPTANYVTFTDPAAAKAYLRDQKPPIVIKADGLAAGKGVVIAYDTATAFQAIDDLMNTHVFGNAGTSVVIEEYLEGEEVSLLAFCDGKTAVPMLPAQDHKRIGDGDTGLNTGGMGTYAPTTIYSKTMAAQVEQTILLPTMKAMIQEGTPFAGTLFLGLMITKSGPKVIEYNVRFGDPETQVVLPLLDSDLAQIFLAAVQGKLDAKLVKWHSGETAVCVVAASAGYPGQYQTGKVISRVDQVSNSVVFHAGTKLAPDGKLLTAGGRVLNVVHRGQGIQAAIDGAYRDLKLIGFDGIYFRKDIGQRELKRSVVC